MASVFLNLLNDEVEKIRCLGTRATIAANEQLFNEGDVADYLYFIIRGQVSLYIEKFNTRVEIQKAEAGDWFGELAVYSGSRRTASAVTTVESEFLRVSKDAFRTMLASKPAIDAKLRDIVDSRNEKLVLKEKMVDVNSQHGRDMHIGIKGDPSLRESAMERERYESIVDRILGELVPCLEDLLLNRSVYRVLIGFNNGEIRLSTLLDPFSEEFHPATRLLDASYIERHFPKIEYQQKADIVRSMFNTIRNKDFFAGIPGHLSSGFAAYFNHWEPVPPEEITNTLSQLPTLRSIPNFYVRSMTIGILKDAIHMQFNCDGTHIVSARGYDRFIQENL